MWHFQLINLSLAIAYFTTILISLVLVAPLAYLSVSSFPSTQYVQEFTWIWFFCPLNSEYCLCYVRYYVLPCVWLYVFYTCKCTILNHNLVWFDFLYPPHSEKNHWQFPFIYCQVTTLLLDTTPSYVQSPTVFKIKFCMMHVLRGYSSKSV